MPLGIRQQINLAIRLLERLDNFPGFQGISPAEDFVNASLRWMPKANARIIGGLVRLACVVDERPVASDQRRLVDDPDEPPGQ